MIPVIDNLEKRHLENPKVSAPDETAPSAMGVADEFNKVIFNLATSINQAYAAALNQAERNVR